MTVKSESPVLVSQADFERFVSQYPREWAEILAGRAAFRTFPLLWPVAARRKADYEGRSPVDSILSVLRAGLITLYAPISGTQRENVRSRADAVFYRAAGFDKNETVKVAQDAILDALRIVMPTSTAVGVSASLRTTTQALVKAATLTNVPAALKVARRDARQSAGRLASKDAQVLLEEGMASLICSPLWHDIDVPKQISTSWLRFRTASMKLRDLGSSLDVWLDLYEAIRDGRSPWGLSRAAADRIVIESILWPHEDWDRGAVHINQRIAELIEAAREARARDREPPSKDHVAPPIIDSSRKGAATRRARTKVGTAAIERGPELLSLCAALSLLVDQRLADLRQSRPNSDAAIEACNREIDQLETMHQQLAGLAAEIEGFRKAATEEASLIAATKSFRSGISSWWQKDQEAICASAARSGLLCLSFGILQTLGVAVSGQVATASLAIVIGGKPIGDALKSMKSIFRG